MVKVIKQNRGFTLVEVIVVAVIVAVLSLVAIQLYQGYAEEARQHTAENLAASAASFMQVAVNSVGINKTEGYCMPNPLNSSTLSGWNVTLSGLNNIYFRAPRGCEIQWSNANSNVTAKISETYSIGDYKYK